MCKVCVNFRVIVLQNPPAMQLYQAFSQAYIAYHSRGTPSISCSYSTPPPMFPRPTIEDRVTAADDCRRGVLIANILAPEQCEDIFRQLSISDLPEDDQAVSYILHSFLKHLQPHVTTKVADKCAAHGWDTPIASKALHRYIELLKKRQIFLKSLPLYDKQLMQSNLDLAHTILGATFDDKSILQISTFYRRMDLYQIRNGVANFRSGLKAYEIMNLMYSGVYAVSISYKHTRISRAELHKDERRIRRAIERTAKELSQDRLLFWCDVIGRTPEGTSWAQTQGLDPYLCMPTLRVVSVGLEREIEESFWMTGERVAAYLRGGMLTYDEDLEGLRIEPWDKTVTCQSLLCAPFEYAKVSLAMFICNPILYYRHARCEEDKLEVMKYGITCALSADLNLFRLSQTEDGMIRIRSLWDLLTFSSLAVIPRSHKEFEAKLSLSRSNREVFIKPRERWRGLEEIIPAFLLLDKSDQETSNFIAEVRSNDLFKMKRLRSSESITEIGCSMWGTYLSCSALRLCVNGFVEEENRVKGRVVSFRVATQEEELLLEQGNNTPKKFCFD